MTNRRLEPRAGKPARGQERRLNAFLFVLAISVLAIGAPQSVFAKKAKVTGFDAVRVLVEYGPV